MVLGFNDGLKNKDYALLFFFNIFGSSSFIFFWDISTNI